MLEGRELICADTGVYVGLRTRQVPCQLTDELSWTRESRLGSVRTREEGRTGQTGSATTSGCSST